MQEKEDVIGYIYGDVGSTEFNFAVNGQNLKKFDYIFCNLSPRCAGSCASAISASISMK